MEMHQVQETLHQMLKRDRAAHGFLFYGEAGLGKKTLAKRFLAELLCTGAEKPCGVCKSCRMLADGVHPDVRFVEHSGKRGGFSVDTVREVCMDLASPPTRETPSAMYSGTVTTWTPGRRTCC